MLHVELQQTVFGTYDRNHLCNIYSGEGNQKNTTKVDIPFPSVPILSLEIDKISPNITLPPQD